MRTFISGFLVFVVVLAFVIGFSQKQKTKNKSFPSVLDVEQETRESTSHRPWLEILADLINPNTPNPDDKTIIKNTPDSDKSRCSDPPLYTEKILTKFAGYILEYPCTVRSHGSISTYFDEEDNSESIYKLYLYLTFNEDESIWKLEHNKLESEKPSFRIILESNGKKIITPPRVKQMDQMDKAYDGKINGLIFYRNQNTIVGYLIDEKDASGNPPAISCSAGDDVAVEEVFSLLENPDYAGRRCSAGWALTPDIYLYMSASTIKGKYAYHFRDVYRIINSGIQDSILSSPPSKD
ncbi:MAG: hypothetical protein DWP95_01225 [Proteobacteria bacterium]|nr:MAG: hypothetical protein DWP95_01225 [Pseudomonadota bacterium]